MDGLHPIDAVNSNQRVRPHRACRDGEQSLLPRESRRAGACVEESGLKEGAAARVLLTCGHVSSGFELVHEVLQAAGLAMAQPSRREQLSATDLQARLLKTLGIDAQSGAEAPAVLGQLWRELAVDLFLANMSADAWGWADAATVPLLDFWHDFDTQSRFVLVYSSPEFAVARALRGQAATAESVDRILTNWIACNHRLLHFFHRHRARCEVVNVMSALHAPAELMQHLAGRWGLPLQAPAIAAMPRAASAVAGRLARALVQHRTDAQALFAELESVTCVDGSAAAVAEALQAWTEYSAQQNELELARADADKLRREMARLQQAHEHAQKTIADRAQWVDPGPMQAAQLELRKENELLLAQLHRVQEELEQHFLRNQQLNQRADELGKALDAQKRSENAQREQLTRENEASARNAAELKAQLQKLGSERDAHAKLAAERLVQIEKLRKQLTESPAEAASPALETKNKELTQENELLLLQLHQVQEELEHYYLQNQELSKKVGQSSYLTRFLRDNQPAEVVVDLRGEIDGENWYHAEEDGRWAGPNKTSTLMLPALLPGKYSLDLHVVDAMTPAILQGMEIYLNGMHIPTEKVLGDGFPAVVQGRFCSEQISSCENWQFEFRFETLMSPAERGEADDRALAVRVKALELLLEEPAPLH
jgi:hypothetical protein